MMKLKLLFEGPGNPYTELPVFHDDVFTVIKEVIKSLDMNIQYILIYACHRIGRGPGANSTPPGIVVRFVQGLNKDAGLRKGRVKGTLSTRYKNMPMSQPVHISEALTLARRRPQATASNY